jgi:hypothetical protein
VLEAIGGVPRGLAAQRHLRFILDKLDENRTMTVERWRLSPPRPLTVLFWGVAECADFIMQRSSNTSSTTVEGTTRTRWRRQRLFASP